MKCGDAVGFGLLAWSKADDGPVCDKCGLGLDRNIGMAVQLLNMVREVVDCREEVRGNDVLSIELEAALITFCTMYHTQAKWPVRPINFMGIVARMCRRQGVMLPNMSGGTENGVD